ncbi:bifunctional copper resistance protein CopD/cytochrome c oxidase assembly protein [Actinomadura barringtoniae]|uniref:Bifunctional copper resistance protein CopD/cytochrome c oxidase assembly protein n=1 Tax=Actinomadura barringtoniae TaxID=1427535 RepID=A0A939PJ23_9ACTN|nr:bifunctional copper resistance protein CopD/cytochrome c oxidase assembly protein [Actinomadura barringtoniae]MBO2449461.1 bifunctional copper resistance protein CopD/cytochrome c oxidase assembly protein [Actinomadura barringtoniae]
MVSDIEHGRVSEAERDEVSPVQRSGPLWMGMAAVSMVVLAVVVRFGGAVSPEVVPGLTRLAAFTLGGLSTAKLAMNVSAAVTVGWLLLTSVFLQAGPDGRLSPQGRRCLRAASLSAVAWAVSTLAVVLFSVADVFGVSPITGISGTLVRSFLVELTQGRALLLVAALATLVAVTAYLPKTPGGTGYLLALTLLGLLPPVFTGHAADAADHALAVYSLAAHILGATVWVGGLVVLVAAAWPLRDRLPEIVARYSTLAGVCFAVVGASGLISAWIRLGGLHLGSSYAALVVAKTVAFAALGTFGWWHRRTGIPALRDGAGAAVFVRIASVEVLVMAATMGLATGLSRTPPPEVAPNTLNLTQLQLGFPLPGPPSVQSYLLQWRLDPLFTAAILAGAVLYAAALIRHRRHDGSWPIARTLAWYAGLLTLLAATGSGLARYSMVLFSAHIVQHLTLSLLAPPLLLLGAPLTLGLRVLPTGAATGRPTRDLLPAALRSRAVRIACHPLVATPLLVATLYGFYFTSLFETSLRNHAFHSLAMAVFTLAGLLFLWPILSPEQSPHRLRPAMRILLPAAVLPFHVLFGKLLMTSDSPLASRWYVGLRRAWGPAPLHDQQAGGVLALALGTVAAFLVVLALANQHVRQNLEDRRPQSAR